MQTTYEQAQLNNSVTFVEMLDILVKIVPLKMLAICQKVGHYFKVCQTSWKPQYRCNKEDSSDPRAEISYRF